MSFFLRFIECEKPQGTNCKGPTGDPTKAVELIGSIFWDLRGWWKIKFLRKKGELSFEKIIVAYFFAYYQTWKYPASNF